jgi:hypothetical protein
MSNNVGVCIIEKFDPENMREAAEILFLSALELEIHLGKFYPLPWTTNFSILHWTLGGLIWLIRYMATITNLVWAINT